MEAPKETTASYAPSTLLNEFEAAAYLSLSVTTLRTWRSTKRTNLRYFKLNKAVRYRVSDLESYLQSVVQEG